MADVVAAARKSTRGTVEKPLHLVLPDKTLYLLVKTTALRDEAGHDLGLVLVFEDLTELERARAAGGLAGGGPADRPRSQEPPDAH